MHLLGHHLITLEHTNWIHPTPSMEPRPHTTWRIVVGHHYKPILEWKIGRYTEARIPRCSFCGCEPDSELGHRRCHAGPYHDYPA